jgi:hypothetical protein
VRGTSRESSAGDVIGSEGQLSITVIKLVTANILQIHFRYCPQHLCILVNVSPWHNNYSYPYFRDKEMEDHKRLASLTAFSLHSQVIYPRIQPTTEKILGKKLSLH